jgi:hypothetical protein
MISYSDRSIFGFLAESADHGTDVSDLLLPQFRIEGQREDLSGRLLRTGEVSRRITQVPVGLLVVDGHGIVNTGGDTVLSEVSPEPVPVRGPHDIEVIAVPGRRRLGRQDEGRLGEPLAVEASKTPPGRDPSFQVLELDAEDRRLQLVEAAIESGETTRYDCPTKTIDDQ